MAFVQCATLLDDPDSEIKLPHDGLLDSIFFSIDQLDTYSSGIFKDIPQMRFSWYQTFLNESYSAAYVLPHERGLKFKKPRPLDPGVEEFMREILQKMRDTYSQEEAQTLGMHAARLFKILNKSKSANVKKLTNRIPNDLSDLDDDVVAVAVVLSPALFTCGKETRGLSRGETKFKKEMAVDFALYFSRTYFYNFAR
jgi:hypothetical protein